MLQLQLQIMEIHKVQCFLANQEDTVRVTGWRQDGMRKDLSQYRKRKDVKDGTVNSVAVMTESRRGLKTSPYSYQPGVDFFHVNTALKMSWLSVEAFTLLNKTNYMNTNLKATHTFTQ